MGQIAAMAGDRNAALEAVRQLQRWEYASPWLVAIVCAQLNNKDVAFAWLEKAYQGREHDLVFANAWPISDNLRADFAVWRARTADRIATAAMVPQVRREDRKGHASCVSGEVCANSVISK